jgi:hypothetical protein
MRRVPGIFNLESTDESIRRESADESIPQATAEPHERPAPKVRNKELGYFLGAMASTIAAILVCIFTLLYLQAMLVRCWMSLGCTDTGIPTPLLLALAGYMLLALFLAALAQRIFKTRFGMGFLLNVAPLVVLSVLYILLIQYQSYSYRSDRIRAARTAISDAPAIHLADVFVKRVDSPKGGVIIFLHVPFTVSRAVRARSLAFLATLEDSPTLKFSSKPECNDGYEEPPYGFHLVDREYSESPLPSYVIRGSQQLEPNKQYYLLQERHFSPRCRVSDYQDFDPTQLHVTLTTRWAEDVLDKGGE